MLWKGARTQFHGLTNAHRADVFFGHHDVRRDHVNIVDSRDESAFRDERSLQRVQLTRGRRDHARDWTHDFKVPDLVFEQTSSCVELIDTGACRLHVFRAGAGKQYGELVLRFDAVVFGGACGGDGVLCIGLRGAAHREQRVHAMAASDGPFGDSPEAAAAAYAEVIPQTFDVVLLDSTQELADKGKAYSQGLLDGAIKKGRSTPEKRDALLSKIKATTSYDDLKG